MMEMGGEKQVLEDDLPGLPCKENTGEEGEGWRCWVMKNVRVKIRGIQG